MATPFSSEDSLISWPSRRGPVPPNCWYLCVLLDWLSSEDISACLEHSIRTTAILLIIAEDVEENPGPIGKLGTFYNCKPTLMPNSGVG